VAVLGGLPGAAFDANFEPSGSAPPFNQGHALFLQVGIYTTPFTRCYSLCWMAAIGADSHWAGPNESAPFGPELVAWFPVSIGCKLTISPHATK